MEKLKFLVPPSALNPYATAIASSSVDFPIPFSPPRIVILLDKGILLLSIRYLIIGISLRYELLSIGDENKISLMETELRTEGNQFAYLFKIQEKFKK